MIRSKGEKLIKNTNPNGTNSFLATFFQKPTKHPICGFEFNTSPIANI